MDLFINNGAKEKTMGWRLPHDPTHPGETLREEFLKPLDITQSAFAEHLGVSFKRINEIGNDRRAVTPETAWLFSETLGTTLQFWTNLKSIYDLVHRSGRHVEPIHTPA